MNIKIEQALKEKNHRYIKIAEYQVCQGTDHLEKIFQDIMDQGGEGIILRDPTSPFEAGRSRGYLKHKVRVRWNIVIIAFTHSLFLSSLSEISRCRSENCWEGQSHNMGMRNVNSY